jgi:outer membrane protein assembly factor BamB
MAVFDVEGWEIVQNHRHVVQDQSILALEYDAETGLILGGTSITGGGGSTPTASEGVVFAWDPDAAEVVWQTPPVPNSQAVTGLTMADGKLFASARGNYVVALDPATGEVLATGQTPRGWVHVAAIGTHSDGMVYGLTGAGIYRVDPTTHEITEVAAFEDGIRCGFALTDDGVYFGSGTHLWMYRW